MINRNGKPLRSLHFDRIWPTLSPEHLSYLELKQDPYFSYIPKKEILPCLHASIAGGQKMAKHQAEHTNYKDLLNRLLEQGLRIRFRQQHHTHPQVRAQYTHPPHTIEVYRNSIQQIQSFFQQSITAVDEEDLICLHLYHEFFHYLEKKDKRLKLAKCTIKQWGPFAIKRRLQSFREISAHAFTQSMMKLDWSPLLLDRLIYYTQQGWTHAQIREQFAKVKEEIQALENENE